MHRGELANQAQLGRIEAHLDLLCERYAFRADAPALKRDVEAFLRQEKAKGVLTHYGFMVHDHQGELSLEVGLGFPKRVGQVTLRLGSSR